MKKIQEKWEEFQQAFVSGGSTEEDIRDMREIFFSGATSFSMCQLEILKNTKDPDECEIQNDMLLSECAEFLDEMAGREVEH